MEFLTPWIAPSDSVTIGTALFKCFWILLISKATISIHNLLPNIDDFLVHWYSRFKKCLLPVTLPSPDKSDFHSNVIQVLICLNNHASGDAKFSNSLWLPMAIGHATSWYNIFLPFCEYPSAPAGPPCYDASCTLSWQASCIS